MSFRGIDAPKISDKLEYGRPSDEPKNAAKISVGDKDVLIQPVKTSTVGPKLLGDQIAAPTNQQSLSGPVDGSDAPSRPRSLQGRVRRMERFTLDMPDKRTLGNKVMRGVFGFVGAVVTGAAGLVAGAIGGSLLGPAGTLGFGIGLGVVGAASGAANAAFLADSISRLFDNAPQDKHLDSAMQSLQGSRGAFAPDEANRLKDVTARDWRNLLSVHQKKPWLGNSKRVGSKADRQQIREAVVLYVAKHGKAEAGAYKKRLIATANSRTPNALQTEINRLKATDIRPKLDATKQGGNSEQKAEAFGTLVRANPDLFSRPSALLASRGMATHAENLGLEHFHADRTYPAFSM